MNILSNLFGTKLADRKTRDITKNLKGFLATFREIAVNRFKA